MPSSLVGGGGGAGVGRGGQSRGGGAESEGRGGGRCDVRLLRTRGLELLVAHHGAGEVGEGGSVRGQLNRAVEVAQGLGEILHEQVVQSAPEVQIGVAGRAFDALGIAVDGGEVGCDLFFGQGRLAVG